MFFKIKNTARVFPQHSLCMESFSFRVNFLVYVFRISVLTRKYSSIIWLFIFSPI